MSTETKHTPGEWSAETIYSNGEPDGAKVISGARRVATCEDGLTQEECEASARLIAAAPDLLAALRQAVGALNDLDYPHETGSTIQLCNEVLKKAQTP